MEWEHCGVRLGKEGLPRSQEAIHRREGWRFREAKDVFSSYDAVRKISLGWRDDPNVRNFLLLWDHPRWEVLE